MRILSICTGMGLLDRAFIDAGHEVIPGCEIDPDMRAMYRALCDGEHLTHALADLPALVHGERFDGVIGGPPCQSFTKLRAIRVPKYPDLTGQVNHLLAVIDVDWFLFENVVPIQVTGGASVRLDAMHFYQPHQSRPRWFTYRNVRPPVPLYSGSVDALRAYPVVAGRLYGPKRGAWLQGYACAAELPFPCVQLQKGLANAVSYPLARAWADGVGNA